MTNLAYVRPEHEKKAEYIDFSENAARLAEARRRRILGLQHRYGMVLLLACVLAAVTGVLSYGTDLTVLLLLAPLGIYLLRTKELVLYKA